MNGPNELECYITLDCKCFAGENTLAYRTHFLAMEKMKCCEYCPRGLIQNTSYSLELMNGPNELERYITLNCKCFAGENTLAYRTHLLAMEKMKCCEYSTWEILADRG
jgi:hypothetical protein